MDKNRVRFSDGALLEEFMTTYHIEIISDETDRLEILAAMKLFIATKMQNTKLVHVLKEVSEEELLDALADG